MSEKKQYSVDEILADLKSSGKAQPRQTVSDMGKTSAVDVDRLIADILSERADGKNKPDAQPDSSVSFRSVEPNVSETPAVEPGKEKFRVTIPDWYEEEHAESPQVPEQRPESGSDIFRTAETREHSSLAASFAAKHRAAEEQKEAAAPVRSVEPEPAAEEDKAFRVTISTPAAEEKPETRQSVSHSAETREHSSLAASFAAKRRAAEEQPERGRSRRKQEEPKGKFVVKIDYSKELESEEDSLPETQQQPRSSTVDLLRESLAEEMHEEDVQQESTPAPEQPDESVRPQPDELVFSRDAARSGFVISEADASSEEPAMPVEDDVPEEEEVNTIWDDLGEAYEESEDSEDSAPTRYIDLGDAAPAENEAGSEADEDDELDEEEGEEGETPAIEYRSPEDEREVYQEILSTRRKLAIGSIVLAVLGGISLLLSLGEALFPQILPSFLRADGSPIVYLAVHFVLLVGSMLACASSVGEGLLSAMRFHPNRDSMISIAALFALVQTVICFFRVDSLSNPSVHLYTLVIIGSLFCGNIVRFLGMNRMILNFRVVSSPYKKSVTSLIDNEDDAVSLTRGAVDDLPVVAVQRSVEFAEDFVAYSTDEDVNDDAAKYLTPLGLAFALLLGSVSMLMTNNLDIALTTAAAVLCVFAPFSYLFSVYFPLSRFDKKYSRIGGAVLSSSEMEDYSYVNAVAVTAHDLFPENAVRLFGIKTFAGQRIDEALIDAASVIRASGSVLTHVFAQIIGGNEKLLRSVDSVIYEDGMGISAWVNNKRVLIGSRELMMNHGISVPSKDYEDRFLNEGHELIYLSTSGELTAVFLTKFFASPEVRAAIHRLGDQGISLIVKSVDAVITQEKLAEIFDEDPTCFKIIPARLHNVYDEYASPVKRKASSVISNGTFAAFAGSLLGVRGLKGSITLASILQFASIALGVLLIILLTVTSGMSEMKTLSLFVFEMVWVLATYLIPRLKNM